MEAEPSPVHKQSHTLVFVVIIIAIIALGAAGFLAARKLGGAGDAVASEADVRAWCQLRKEWARKVDALSGDLLLKAATPNMDSEYDILRQRRQGICRNSGKKVRDMVERNVALWNAVQAVELALIKEGKTRSNISVEIHNATAQLALEDPAILRRDEEILGDRIQRRIASRRKDLDEEVARGLKPLNCSGIYQGPMVSEGTADDPYISWDELEVLRNRALKRVRDRLIELEPQEQFSNQVYHDLVVNYRGALRDCYRRAKKKNPNISRSMGLRVRLKKSGQVQTLGIEWMEPKEESLLDCLLESAATWQLPRPVHGGNAVVVTVDFSVI